MSRLSTVFVVLVMAVVVAACGGGSAPVTGNGSTFDPAATPNPDLPGLSNVVFGTAFDPATLAVTGKLTTAKAGSPLVAVGRSLAPRAAADTKVLVTTGGKRLDPIPVTASINPDSGDLFAVDLGPLNLSAGTWIVNFVNPQGRIVAAGSLQITP